MSGYDAIVVGSGPNGLAAAVELARAGVSVLVLEAAADLGGGTRTAELTLPGYFHDVCSAVHPLGILSPYFRTLPLETHGLRWVAGKISAAHPLDGRPAAILRRSVEETAAGLGADGPAYIRLVTPFLRDPHGLFADMLGPFRFPKHPFAMLRFGLKALRSATGLADSIFREPAARGLFAGCAAHAVLPLETPLTAAIGLMFLLTAHVETWPVAEGGSKAISAALINYLRALGGEVRAGAAVKSFAELPPSKVVLFDTSPKQVLELAGDRLPPGYLRRLQKFRYGPGIFKVDWALDGPVPWTDPACSDASTVHLGGTIEEVAASERAAWNGEHCEKPFLLYCQQSNLDPSRAPPGKHTGYAYCHVPNGSNVDLTEAVEAQVERFAPGFRDRILARHVMRAPDFERYNPNYVGGAIGGGVADFAQLFTRPVTRWDPYSTPDPRIFFCSASTPPGGGVHGMCGYFAARSALRRLAAT